MNKISLAVEIDSLGKLVKDIELERQEVLDPLKYTIFRLDGHKFSTFTKSFNSPCDNNLKNAMIKTASDLLNYHNACTVYTQSDEITILLSPRTLDFGGRRQKLETLTASYCSVRFNYWLLEELNNYNDEEKISINKLNKIKGGIAHFDCRILQCDEKDVVNIFRWRYLDAFRNGISSMARYFFSSKQLFKKNNKEMIDMISKKFEDENKDINMFDAHLIHGTWIKKNLVKKEFIDNNGATIFANRAEIVTWSGEKEFKTMSIPDIIVLQAKYYS